MSHFYKLTPKEYVEYLIQDKWAGTDHEPLGAVLHHTYIPTVKQWRGEPSMRSIEAYHMSIGGRKIFANSYTDEEYIWPARGLGDHNYAHAHIRYSWNACPSAVHDIFHASGLPWSKWRKVLNKRAPGFETVGNGAVEDPATWVALQINLDVIAAMFAHYDLEPERCLVVHRGVASKSAGCPGWNVSVPYIHAQLHARMGTMPGDLKVVTRPDAVLVDCAAKIEDGVTRIALRPLLEELGHPVYDRINEQGRIYVGPQGPAGARPVVSAGVHAWEPLKVIKFPDGVIIPCRPRVEDDTTRADMRALCVALGHEVYDRIGLQGKVYVDR